VSEGPYYTVHRVEAGSNVGNYYLEFREEVPTMGKRPLTLLVLLVAVLTGVYLSHGLKNPSSKPAKGA
jgi:hypothetical protein